MAKGSGLGEALIFGVVAIIALLLLPRVFNSIAVNNARVAAQNQPSAAANSAWARIIGAGGDVGVGLVNQVGGYLWQQNPLQVGTDTGN